MTSTEARKLIKQLESTEESESDGAYRALHSFVLEATEQEIWSKRRLKVLDTIESGLSQLLSDLEGLEARRENNFANSLISIVKAMAERAEAIVPVLSKVFLQADPDTSRLAADALALIVFSNGNSNALDVLVSRTGTEYQPSLRLRAVQALGLLGKRGVGVQPVLRTLLNDSDTEIRKASIMALGKQRERALPVVPDLLDMLKQDSELADCLQTSIEKITGKPSPITWPRKSRVHYLGQAAYDSEVYERRGYTISFPGIPGFTVNLEPSEPAEKPAKKPVEERNRNPVTIRNQSQSRLGRISLQNIDAMMKASDVETQIEGQVLSFRGDLGRTRIDISPSGHKTADGLEVAEIVRIETLLDEFPFPGNRENLECMFNCFASNEAVIVGDDGKILVKSRLSVYSGEGEDAIGVYEKVTFLAAMIHTMALNRTIIDVWRLPAPKGDPLPYASLDGMWKSERISLAASMLKARRAFVNADERGLSAEFPWDPGAFSALESRTTGSKKRTSLLTMWCDQHPGLGNGLLCKLSLPLRLSDKEAYKLASSLNRIESDVADWAPFLGAWTSKPESGFLTFVNFWPNIFSDVIGVEMIAIWMFARASAIRGWIRANTEIK